MADYSSLEAIEKRIAASGRPMTRAEASTLAPLRTKRRKDEEAMAEQSRPKTRAEAATRMKQAAAPAESDRYKGLRDVPTKVGEAVLDTATQGMYSAAKLAAPAVKSAIEFLGRESSQPVRNRAEAATYMKNRQMAPATSTPESPVPTPVAATEPQDDIRSMVEATGNALSAEPVLDEPTISEPIGNVSTDLGPPKAKVVIDENRMSALFRKTTGTNFNPKSRVDKERMAQLTSFIEEDPERLNKSDTKIALDFYRTL